MGKNKNEKAKSSAKKALREQQKQKKKRMRAIKDVVSMVLIVGVFAGIFVGLLWAAGTFDYHPEPTYDVLITIENYGSVHVELYGNDAPETVKHFLSLVNSGYYNGKSVYKLFDDLAYMGTDATDKADIKGEFAENGFDNKISHKRGVLSMVRGETGSAYGQFFIVGKNSPELNGKHAAFGCVTSGMEVIDAIFKNVPTSDNGSINKENQPKITSISAHASHDH
jgi:peptidyl-prolyl cis-trans isomerase B (cyclophilin B)